MNEEKILDKMMEIGINKYEAKAYMALLERSGITAYELSKISKVPQAKIYETMNKLLEKRLVNIIGGNPTKYAPVDFDDYLDDYKKSVNKTVKFLKDNVKERSSESEVSYIWHLQEKENIINKVKKVLDMTKKFVYIEAWEEDYEYFKEDLKELSIKGIEIVTVLYGNTNEPIGKIYYHQMDEMNKNVEIHGRWFTLVSDGERSLFSMFNDKKSQGIYTENEAFMLMAESFIVHDIFLAEIYKKYKKELDDEFGPNLRKIREKIKIG